MSKFFFRVRTENGIAWDIDASSFVWTLTDNGKLANQIARLVAAMVKLNIDQIMNKVLLLQSYIVSRPD